MAHWEKYKVECKQKDKYDWIMFWIDTIVNEANILPIQDKLNSLKLN